MTVKIDRFKIIADGKYTEKNVVSIVDYLEYRTIVEFRTNNKELNMALAKIVLDELNSRDWSDYD